ncbi:rhizopine catabolism transcriptional regulator MocR [Frigidibacter sp. ROC022]|uniref:rhizopine catabolism transcriptional regulator MocR n=1 Tax=Frigidibacter sp. ROC022 TaxID=2971796 RepID=UPI00215A0DAA|nr:PLP-dependent aminotransferase family protein [Frigidibacter sp. ROC022]MCR8723530.1 PLP-dependent aminotransferase family protein [Frigidibacter sp. ROC022]
MTAGLPVDNLILDRRKRRNLHRQLYDHLRRMIETRALPPGAPLPATRALAQDLGLSRNTVIAAYDQLALEGFVEIRRGVAPVVLNLPARPDAAPGGPARFEGSLSNRGRTMAAQPFHHGSPGITAFHPGLPDISRFPFNTWARLTNRRAKSAASDLFGTYHVEGYPPLREAIARYLTASRGVVCSPEQIIVTNGAQAAFDLLARCLLDPGDTVWMEEPGYYGMSSAFVSAGARLEPLRINRTGWALTPPAVPPKVIFVTPSCQHPLGLTMAMQQRLDLIRMAERWRAWIIEDDYDSEYRFQGQPIPALQGIASNAGTIFVGTFAKILFPAMRLGYMVVPDTLREPMRAALSSTGHFAPLISQAALTDFINGGHLTRHLRRMRRLYAERREYFIETFERLLSDLLTLRRTDTGIQLVARFNSEVDDKKAVQIAAQHGVNVSALSMQFRHQPAESGLVMGFAAPPRKEILRGLGILADVLPGR